MALQTKTDASLFLTMDGLRGIGAIMVVIGHSLVFWGGLPMQIQLMPYLVDMFFVFSGFVIAYAFEPRLARGLSVGGFLLQRVIRLYPIYLIGIFMGLCVHVVMWMDNQVDPGLMAAEVLPQFFMLPSLNTDSTTPFTLNNPAWSLFFELWVNVVYVLIFRFLSTRVLVGVVLLFAVLMVIASYAYGDLNVGWSWANIWGGFPRAGFGFFIGVLIFRLRGSPTAAPRKGSGWAWLLMLSPIPLAMFAMPEDWKIPVQLAAAFVFGPVVIWLSSRIQPPRFIGKLCMRAGALSYGLYMLHFSVLVAVVKLEGRFPGMQTDYGPWIGAGILVVVIAIAWVVERYYDAPVRRWIGRKLKHRVASRSLKPPQVASK